MLRDPLCYIFCLTLPLAMLAVMHFAFYDETTTFWFGLDILTPGIMCFSYAFVMLYLALLVSQDRSTSFLTRLYTSPMRPAEFIAGYMLPGIVIGIGQALSCSVFAVIINIIEEGSLTLSVPGLLMTILTSIPSLLIYASIGILFGSCFSDKSAPGLCSAVITVSAFLSGAWMVVDESSVLGIICRILPFYPTVKVGRFALHNWGETAVNQTFDITGKITKITESVGFDTCWSNLLIVLAWGIVLVPLAVAVFSIKTKSDNR